MCSESLSSCFFFFFQDSILFLLFNNLTKVLLSMYFLKFILLELTEPLWFANDSFIQFWSLGQLFLQISLCPLLFISLLILESPFEWIVWLLVALRVLFILFILLFFYSSERIISIVLSSSLLLFLLSVTIYYWNFHMKMKFSSEIFISFILFNSRISVYLECLSLYLHYIFGVILS